MKAAGCSRVRVCITLQGNAFSEFANKYKLEMRKDIKQGSFTCRGTPAQGVGVHEVATAIPESLRMAICAVTAATRAKGTPRKTATLVVGETTACLAFREHPPAVVEVAGVMPCAKAEAEAGQVLGTHPL